jgi:hypothetical protein
VAQPKALAIKDPNRVSSPFNRSLFAQMPPSIVITEPVPRWKVWVQQTLRIAFLSLFCAVSFYAGVLYGRYPQTGAAAPATVAPKKASLPAEPVVPVVAQQPASPALPALMLEPRALEGLQIQSLRLSGDPTVSGRLRYEFELLNEGRLYEGNFEFMLQGQQEGRVQQWAFPAASQAGNAAYRLRVARYLKMDGTIQLPPGFMPQAVVLSLREPAGVRASRGLELPETGNGTAAAPAR